MPFPENGSLQDLCSPDHLCWTYRSAGEQLSAVALFVQIGLERGERCLWVLDENTFSGVTEALRSQGILVDEAINAGALRILTKYDCYLKQGYFDPDWMVQFVREQVKAAKDAGFKALRATGEMSWATGSEPGVERFLEYEAKLNRVAPDLDALIACQYNWNHFQSDVVREILYVHPGVITENRVRKNPYYLPT